MSDHAIPVPATAATREVSDPTSAYQKLLHDVTLTKNCRFYASRRTGDIAWSFLLAITALSVINIVMSIVSIVFGSGLTDFQVRIIGVVIVVISVYLIVLDLIVAGRAYDTRRFVHDRGGKALLKLRNEMVLKGDSPENNKYYHKKYSQILAEYGENHDDVDFRYAKAFGRDSFSFDGLLASVSYRLSAVKLFIFVMIPVVIGLWLAYSYFGVIPLVGRK